MHDAIHTACNIRRAAGGLQGAVESRRSALKLARDAPPMPRAAFLAALRALCACPLQLGSGEVHILLMVHSVEGLPPGLYLLARGGDLAALQRFARGSALEDLRGVVDAEADPGLRSSLEELADAGGRLLVVAAPVDVREAAQLSACNQEIAGHGAFAAAFLGRFAGWRRPHEYLELHWEAGVLGQVLYLAAHAAGLGATGIGCFFDDFTLSLLRDAGGADAGSSQVGMFCD